MHLVLAAVTLQLAAPPAAVIDVAKLTALVVGVTQLAKQYIPASRANRATDIRLLAVAVAVAAVLAQAYLPAGLVSNVGLGLSIAGASLAAYQGGSAVASRVQSPAAPAPAAQPDPAPEPAAPAA